ncbi:hypothetical protein HPP92_019297 [Vanilla planifolia]|uniref:Alpha/beta-Hydrolases superfamily protein n=1 Tax=Vanilla planifolia TaxID=51239 RepID=A0A835QEN1_VANPL|nr:hypothetical protein HPP92_019297 [Vanilla planifolia]
MLRLLTRPRRLPLVASKRRISSNGFSSSSSPLNSKPINHLRSPPPALNNPIPPTPLTLTSSSSYSNSTSLFAAAGAITSFIAIAAYLYFPTSSDGHARSRTEQLYADLEETLEKSKSSLGRVLHQMVQTGAAAAVLWKSLVSVLSSANQEVRSGFELRVAALLADIAGASDARRSAIVGAGGGAVVDWLLERVASSRTGVDYGGTQAESARALAHLIADPVVCEKVLGRPHAVPNLLKFIFSFQPRRQNKQFRFSSFERSDLWKGRSMLVAALMDIVTSNSDAIDDSAFRLTLSGDADMRDVALALQVIEEGGVHFDDDPGNEDCDDGNSGVKGIGIKVLGGTSSIGLSRRGNGLNYVVIDDHQLNSSSFLAGNMDLLKKTSNLSEVGTLVSSAVPGLWDDLQREHVAVPFAAWALANWALASHHNRSCIQELDQDGHAVMTALTAAERSVKWHGSFIARALLADYNLPLTFSVSNWSSSLLSTAYQASKVEDVSLAQIALSALLVSVDRSNDAKSFLNDRGLQLLREMAMNSLKNRHLQEALVRVLELLYGSDMHLPLDESQKWCGILLRWVFQKVSSESTRSSAIKILLCILEDYGPDSIPISQGWLAIMLAEILEAAKTSALKGNTILKSDKVKTQIDKTNANSAAQVVAQLSTAVIKQAKGKLESESDSTEMLPLADFLSLEPFAPLLRSMNRSNQQKLDAADLAVATLKGIKALREVCSEDATCQNKLVDFGVLCLLRRLLMGDDYEKLAANETYLASRALESQERASLTAADQLSSDTSDPSSIRVPPTAHIRRHAAQLLTDLSLLSEVKSYISKDKLWCQWLENCASRRIPCCNDPKIQSYARATLLNVFCSDGSGTSSIINNVENRSTCAQYKDLLFLINTELPHWKCSQRKDLGDSSNEKDFDFSINSSRSDGGHVSNQNDCNAVSVNGTEDVAQVKSPSLDVVFVHGLRGGPFKSWRMADDKISTTSKAGLVEHIDQEAGKEGTFWPGEWLSADFPEARLFTLRYKTKLTQWTGASLPLQEVSSMLLEKLLAAGIGNHPTVFITHSMGGLVVKQMLYQAKLNNLNSFLDNTIGILLINFLHLYCRYFTVVHILEAN